MAQSEGATPWERFYAHRPRWVKGHGLIMFADLERRLVWRGGWGTDKLVWEYRLPLWWDSKQTETEKQELMKMATKLETLNAAFAGQGCLGKAAPDEPVFVLRAQDIHAADLVEKWAIWSAQNAPKKAQEALLVVEAMRAWPVKKAPD